MHKGIRMTFYKLVFSFMIAMCLSAVVTASDMPLSLPTKSPELMITNNAQLGTNEASIGLSVGDKVSAFSISNHEGNAENLTSLLQQAPILVIFYRGGWCPYCNLQIRELTESWPQFKQRGVTPVLISVDEIEGASLALRTYEIPFPVLSDPDLKAHHAFKVSLVVDDITLKKYEQYGIDLERWSKRKHHTIAVASAFIVNAQAKVLWAHTSTDYTTRPSAEQLLNVIDQLKLP